MFCVRKTIAGMTCTILALLSVMGAAGSNENFFPIGAWYPGMGISSVDLDSVLSQVKEAGFNTIHGPLNYSTDNNIQVLTEAQEHGLKVELNSWGQWRYSRTFYVTFEAESDHFWRTVVEHPIGGSQDQEGWRATVSEQSEGYMMKVPGWNVDFSHIEGRMLRYTWRMKVSDNTVADTVAVLELRDFKTGSVYARKYLRGTDFVEPNAYQDQSLDYYWSPGLRLQMAPEYGDIFYVKLEINVWWTGKVDMWVDKVVCSTSTGRKVVTGEYDNAINDSLDVYRDYKIWRFFVNDEPWYYWLASSAHIDSILSVRGYKGLTAFTYPPFFQLYVDWMHPKIFLVDFYPIYADTKTEDESGYNESLQNRLDPLVNCLALGKSAAEMEGIPFWFIVQTHSWKQTLREPSPREIRAMVNLALAYGVNGIYYFLYRSLPQYNSVGLVDTSYVPNSKWYEVRDINAKLDLLHHVLLSLNWKDAFDNANIPGGSFVHSVSGDDVHIGTFEDNYVMLVNRRCASSDTQEVIMKLKASSLAGTGLSYSIRDVYTKEAKSVDPDVDGLLTYKVVLPPGDGVLLSVHPIPTISLPHKTAIPGGRLRVPIQIDQAAGVAGADMVITYNGNMLLPLMAKTTSLTDGSLVMMPYVRTKGKARILLANNSGLSSGNGPLVDLVFRVLRGSQPGGRTEISFQKLELYDQSGLVISSRSRAGSVTIIYGPEGDVNGDGQVTPDDVTLCLKIVGGSITPTSYQLWAADIDNDGEVTVADAILIMQRASGTSKRVVPPSLPRMYSLSQNYPNPFNLSTNIKYQLPEKTQVRLSIYNTLGQKVKTLVEETQDAGYYSVIWDGRDELGVAVASGVYLYRLETDDFVRTRRMTLTQ